MNNLRPLKHWDRGFESVLKHRCLCAFILCLCCPGSGSDLRGTDPPSKEFYRLCKIWRNWKGGQVPTKGCRANRYTDIVELNLIYTSEFWLSLYKLKKLRNSSIARILQIWRGFYFFKTQWSLTICKSHFNTKKL
jgi:hypothetical protein